MNQEQLSAFRKASRAYSDASIFMHEAIALKAGLSGTDHKYLGLIMQKEKMTAGEISEVTKLTTGAVTGLVDRLEEKKLVKRQPDQYDRRKVFIIPQIQNIEQIMTPLFTDLQEKTTALLAQFSVKDIQVIQSYFSSATVLMQDVTKTLNQS